MRDNTQHEVGHTLDTESETAGGDRLEKVKVILPVKVTLVLPDLLQVQSILRVLSP